jgi:hypothetical protein
VMANVSHHSRVHSRRACGASCGGAGAKAVGKSSPSMKKVSIGRPRSGAAGKLEVRRFVVRKWKLLKIFLPSNLLTFLITAIGQHGLQIMRGRVEAGLNDPLNTPLAEDPGDLFCEGCETGGGAGDEDSGLS